MSDRTTNTGIIVAAIITAAGGLAAVIVNNKAVSSNAVAAVSDPPAAEGNGVAAPGNAVAVIAVEPAGNAAAEIGLEPEPEPEAMVDTAPPAPAPMLSHAIKLENNCDRTVEIYLYYKSTDGWIDSGGEYWTYKTGEATYPTYRDIRLYALEPEVYLFARSTDGNKTWTGDYTVLLGTKRYQMLKANISVQGNGDYTVALDCPN